MRPRLGEYLSHVSRFHELSIQISGSPNIRYITSLILISNFTIFTVDPTDFTTDTACFIMDLDSYTQPAFDPTKTTIVSNPRLVIESTVELLFVPYGDFKIGVDWAVYHYHGSPLKRQGIIAIKSSEMPPLIEFYHMGVLEKFAQVGAFVTGKPTLTIGDREKHPANEWLGAQLELHNHPGIEAMKWRWKGVDYIWQVQPKHKKTSYDFKVSTIIFGRGNSGLNKSLQAELKTGVAANTLAVITILGSSHKTLEIHHSSLWDVDSIDACVICAALIFYRRLGRLPWI